MMHSQIPRLSDFLPSSDYGVDLVFVPGDSALSETDKQRNRSRNKPRNSRRKPQMEKETVRRCNSETGVESDTGSDGMAVNSGGSGRSGDWGPSSNSRRQQSRHLSSSEYLNAPGTPRGSRPSTPVTSYGSRLSWFDSGISMSTSVDSKDPVFVHDLQPSVGNEQAHLGGPYSMGDSGSRHSSSSDSDRVAVGRRETSDGTANLAAPRRRDLSSRRSSSCSDLPTALVLLSKSSAGAYIGIDVLGNNDSDVTDSAKPKKKLSDAQKQVLRQIYGRRAIAQTQPQPVNEAKASDTSSLDSKSKFPLPEHLDYPLNLYRDSEEKSSRSAMQRIKAKFRKNKSKTVESTMPNEVFSVASATQEGQEEVDSIAILSRLAHDPVDSKGIFKKLLSRIGGKTYSAQDDENNKGLFGLFAKKNLHSSSEDISTEFEHFRPRANTLTKTTSMPNLDPCPNDEFYEFPNERNLASQIDESYDAQLPIVNSKNAFAYVSFRTDRSSSFRGRADSLRSNPSSTPDHHNASKETKGSVDSVTSSDSPRSTMPIQVDPNGNIAAQYAVRGRRSSSAGNIDTRFIRARDCTAGIASRDFSTSYSFSPKDIENEMRKTASCYDLYTTASGHYYGAGCAIQHDPGRSGNAEHVGGSYGAWGRCCHHCGSGGPGPYVDANAAIFHPQYMLPYYHAPAVYGPGHSYPSHAVPLHNYQHPHGMHNYHEFYQGQSVGHAMPHGSAYRAPIHYHHGPSSYPQMRPTRNADGDRVLAPLDVNVKPEKKAELRKISDMTFDTFV